MKKYFIVMILWSVAMVLYAQDTVTIGKIMYQNQAFTAKDKQIFDADKEGSRVWSLGKAVKYCKKLKLDGYDDWRIASKKEFQAIMTRKPSKNGLFVKAAFASKMPLLGGKYDNVWMWTRFSKTPNLGEYVNFKKAKSGWANEEYKGYVICTRGVIKKVHKKKSAPAKPVCKQESTHSRNWVKAWHTCSGYTALKKDGTLWQFGKVGGCGWGGIIPIIPVDPQTGKPFYKIEKKYRYYLQPKKIGSGFKKAKFTNGGYRMYAIKKDGTLWGWGEGLGTVPRKLSKSHNWSSFGIRYEGNGCCGYDVGLKKDGSLWRFPESFGYKSVLKLQKISQFNNWKKIILGCCNIYGLRKNGTLWKFSQIGNEKVIFKRFIPKKKSYDGDTKLYTLLKSKMEKVPYGTVYNPENNAEMLKANRNGTLCLSPEEVDE